MQDGASDGISAVHTLILEYGRLTRHNQEEMTHQFDQLEQLMIAGIAQLEKRMSQREISNPAPTKEDH